MTFSFIKWIFVSYMTKMAASQEGSHFGVVYAEGDGNKNQGDSYCMMYNPEFHPVPQAIQDAPKFSVVDIMPSMLCEEVSDPPDFGASAVAVARGNCTFSEKARFVQDYHGTVALIISDSGISEPVANSSSDYNEINVTVAVMASVDYESLKSLGSSVRVQLYAPGMPHVDYNLILIWAMAVITVLVGGYWSGHVRHRQYMRKLSRGRRQQQGSGPSERSEEMEDSDAEDEQNTIDASPQLILIFVILMCGMLVALYFFYDYLVYVIIAMFTLAASTALYSCIKPFWLRIPCFGNCSIPMQKVPFVRSKVEVRCIILSFLCLGVGVTWAVMRNEEYAWIVQDILGVVFCVHMMKTLRLPSLKVVSILLVLLFFYDIFFVFITPLFTKSGESVMVEVATGSGSESREMLPMVLKVPRFSSSTLSVCALPFSLLGFGDILVPGLLVAFCSGHDRLSNNGGIYFIASVIGYGVGLLVTFLALALMSSGQPALLYLVPCTLITVSVIAACRKEFSCMWRGEIMPSVKKNDPALKKGPKKNATRHSAPAGRDMNADVSSLSSTDNEERNLIS